VAESGAGAPECAGDRLLSGSEDPGRLVDADVASHHVLEDEGAMLRPPIRVWVSPFHASDGDKVAGRLARTESLADDTTSEIGLTGVDRGDTIQLSDV